MSHILLILLLVWAPYLGVWSLKILISRFAARFSALMVYCTYFFYPCNYIFGSIMKEHPIFSFTVQRFPPLFKKTWLSEKIKINKNKSQQKKPYSVLLWKFTFYKWPQLRQRLLSFWEHSSALSVGGKGMIAPTLERFI